MNRVWQTAACGAVFVMLAAPALAQQSRAEPGDPPRTINQPQTRATTVVADAPGVRLAGLIANDGRIVRNKGIASVNKPDVGVFCITPKAGTGVKPTSAIVQVTVAWNLTRFNESMVQWPNNRSFCASNQFEIYTLQDANLDARYNRSDFVGFSIIIP